ncbi:MAG: hypothetical protein ED559_06190 [Phycisphaera sp.]|nr:MAG: hypothetical protein ED559_06190 [Phycisphaera sp.]
MAHHDIEGVITDIRKRCNAFNPNKKSRVLVEWESPGMLIIRSFSLSKEQHARVLEIVWSGLDREDVECVHVRSIQRTAVHPDQAVVCRNVPLRWRVLSKSEQESLVGDEPIPESDPSWSSADPKLNDEWLRIADKWYDDDPDHEWSSYSSPPEAAGFEFSMPIKVMRSDWENIEVELWQYDTRTYLVDVVRRDFNRSGLDFKPADMLFLAQDGTPLDFTIDTKICLPQQIPKEDISENEQVSSDSSV